MFGHIHKKSNQYRHYFILDYGERNKEEMWQENLKAEWNGKVEQSLFQGAGVIY